jgi:hypothetical protein
MTPVVQSRIGNRGTCFRAALASILNLREDQVPDFPQANQDPGVNRFLAKYGLRYEQRPITDPAPAGWGTVEGTSPRGGEHACVRYGGKLVWDPHPQDSTGQGLVEKKTWGVLMPVSEEVMPVGDVREFVVRETPKGWVVFEDGLSGYPFPTKEKAVKHAEGIAAIRTVNGQRAPVRVEAKDVAPVGDATRGKDGELSRSLWPALERAQEKFLEVRKAGWASGDSKYEKAYREFQKAKLAFEDARFDENQTHQRRAKDSVLSNTALLLAALWAWYRSRMDAPALEPRNWDLNNYVPRQRAFDGSKFEWKCPKCGQAFTGESSDPLEDRAWHHLETVHNDESTLVKIHRNTE